uniref:LOV domain-containing protein n=1 Tax=Grammatophora oceanica TaxID=210454 RepID=A0A7S1VJW0_9STRA|eukprot:CAMPEP_0194042468 /NCGR_PEP_ID=MMETSP0009_2-20130614/14235_1 /TAXON_ID=210454 /ORGANISM="Grammatophora oceanica, Strain CCMP 410" /LENGTH=379 /DNA_ID=CAMNT_0038686325 /DNA_START=83 /DNA_END=1222 /DNA_ORIENTATION=+
MSAPGLSASATAAVAQRGTPATLNLDDIFGDVLFTPEGETVFMSELQGEGGAAAGVLASGEKDGVASVASRMGADGQLMPVAKAGGIQTTQLDQKGKAALAMGAGESTMSVPFQRPPQQRHHLQYATPEMAAALKKRKAAGSKSERKMSEQQKVERRERNREHAKRSRIRKKFLLESLQQSVSLLKDENEKLRSAIRSHLGAAEADKLMNKHLEGEGGADAAGLIADSSMTANKVLDDPDFSFIKALQTAQQNFVVTDPSLPDNPIVYATQGFLNLTGYTLDQVLGRNCRFLQGPETDPKAVEKIRKSIEEGTDMSVCLLNYRVDGTTFWNQFFIAALRDASGNITNYVGVQCKVSDQYAANVCKKQEEADAAEAEEGS